MRLQSQVILLLVSLSFSTSLVGCKQQTVYPGVLLRVDSLMAYHSDSALYMLELLDDFMPMQSEEIQMYHGLLKTKAKEICKRQHVSDSLMKRVMKYYQENGPLESLMEAYFLLACIYRDLNHELYALEYYQKAIGVHTDYPLHSLKSRAYNQMGILFSNQGMCFEATDAYRKACFHARLGCDSLEIAQHYKNLADNYAICNKMDSTIKYLELAGRYDAKGTVNERINMYIRQKDFGKALKVLNESGESYSEWGDYYHEINKRDSASIFYLHALDSGSVDDSQKLNIYRRLAVYAEEQGRIMQALMYTKIVNGLLDSLNVNHKMEAEDRMRALYSRYGMESDLESSLQEKRENKSGWWFGTILLIGGVLGLLHYNRKKRFSSKNKLSDMLEFPICQLVKTHANNPDFKLNDTQWKELEKEMDAAFNGFTSRLLDLYSNLSEVELHVCCLVKLGVSPKNIAHIVVRQRNTISSIRERLSKKIYGEEGTSKQLDEFIKNF